MIPALAFIVAAYTITRLIQSAIIIDAHPQTGSGAMVTSWVLTAVSILLTVLMVVKIMGEAWRVDNLLSKF